MLKYCMTSALCIAVLAAVPAAAQNYPTKTVRIFTSEAGGGFDYAARLVAQNLSASLGQQFIVDNRGGGILLAEIAAKAPADGYSLLVVGNNLWLAPYLQQTPYDPIRDFMPVSLMISNPNLLVTHPSLPTRNVKELIAIAQAKPGELNCATGNVGSATHLALELFNVMAKTKIARIPYKAAGPAVQALIGGQVHLMVATAGSVTTHVKSGRLKALAVTSLKPSTLFPGMPTVSATIPGYEYVGLVGLFAPARTPQAIVDRLGQEVNAILSRPEIRERFFTTGVEVVAGSPAEFAKVIQADMSGMGRVIKEAGIKGD